MYTCFECQTTRQIPAPPHIGTGQVEMDVDVDEARAVSLPSTNGRRRRKITARSPRLPPLCGRENAGHVLLVGNEQKTGPGEGGKGIYVL